MWIKTQSATWVNSERISAFYVMKAEYSKRQEYEVVGEYDENTRYYLGRYGSESCAWQVLSDMMEGLLSEANDYWLMPLADEYEPQTS